MGDNLCLKWNNHSFSFIKSIGKIQTDERFCDATIACQGQYFPVHRIVLSTCSDYFDEIFDKMKCQHPYIVFKDIEPKEMELLLTYMYQGEVNVVQAMLPTLIKAAEALKVKGLAVPDDVPSSRESTGKKRSSSYDNSVPKRRLDENRRRGRNSSDLNVRSENNEGKSKIYSAIDSTNSEILDALCHHQEDNEPKIKEEPVDNAAYNMESEQCDYQSKQYLSESLSDESAFIGFPSTQESSDMKGEGVEEVESYDEQLAVTWDNLVNANISENPPAETSSQDDRAVSNNESCTGNMTLRKNAQMDPSHTTSFTLKNSLISSVNTYKCPFCEHKTQRKHSLKQHVMQKHTGERPFPCSYCYKSFVKKVDLIRHVRVHTGEKPYACPNCFKRFSQKVSLRHHLQKSC